MIDKNRPVLVADDDDYFRLALSALLKGPLGFAAVIETASLDEALERLSAAGASGIGLALFDLSMPGMDGPATLGAVRECHPDVRVVVVSASQSRRHVLEALETGVHGYIPKGFGPAELIRALNVIVGGDIFVPAFLAEGTERSSTPRGDAAGAVERGGAAAALLASISPRQRQVLGLLVHGHSNKRIAAELALGEGTVKIHVAALLRKLGVSSRAAAAAAAARMLQA